MKPSKIEVEGFRPYQDKLLIDFSDLNSVSVTGPNGAGKSSLFIDSLLFALYGKTRKRSESLINDLCEKMSVSLWLEHNGSNYRVLRSLERGKNQVLKLYCNEIDISERLATQTQKKLDEILNLSYELLLSTSIAQQEDINKLSQMGPTDREKVLSEMLNIEQWEIKKKKVNDILNKYQDTGDSIKISETNIKENANKINELQKLLDSSKKTKLECENLIGTKQKEFDKFTQEYNKLQSYQQLESKKGIINSQLDNLNNLIREATNNIDRLGSSKKVSDKIKENESKIISNKELIKDIDSGLNDLQEEIDKTARWESEARQLTISERQLTILDEVPCKGLDIHDTCKLLSSSLEIKKQVDKLIKLSGCKSVKDFQLIKLTELESLSDRKQGIINSKNKLLLENNTLFNNNKYLEDQILQADNNLKNLTNLTEQKIKLKKQLLELDKTLENKPDFNKDNYIILQNEINRLNADIIQLTSEISKYETEINIRTKNIEESNKLIEKYKQIEAKVANYKTLQQAYTDIPSLLFEEAIPTLEDYSNEILEKIFPDERVSLRSFRETKSNTLQKSLDVVGRTSTGERDFEDLSGSEKFRQSLALRLALSRYNSERNGTKVSFFIVDEGFGSLDSANVYAMKLMLRDIANRFDLFIIITHLDELTDTFDKKIVINPNGKAEKVQIV